MKPQDLSIWLPIIAALIAAGMWLGRLDGRIQTLEQRDRYEHGTYQIPQGAK